MDIPIGVFRHKPNGMGHLNIINLSLHLSGEALVLLENMIYFVQELLFFFQFLVGPVFRIYYQWVVYF
jgi:hypothetical protein